MSGETVLVVEDHPDILLTLRLTLESSGYTVIGAESAEEALDRLAAARPDLVLLDVTLPQMTGWELLGKIRATEGIEALPVVMLTGHVGDEVSRQALALGASGLLAKPFEVAKLTRTVRDALAAEGSG